MLKALSLGAPSTSYLAAEISRIARLDLHNSARGIYSVDVGGEQHVERSDAHELHVLVLHQPVAAVQPPAGDKAFELEARVSVVLHVVPAPVSHQQHPSRGKRERRSRLALGHHDDARCTLHQIAAAAFWVKCAVGKNVQRAAAEHKVEVLERHATL